MEIRINKYLSQCNIGSRRQIESFIKDGLITVNGKTGEVGQMINTETDTLTFKGQILEPTKNFFYYALNKPKGVVATASDEFDRETVMDFIQTNERLYPVGRLDRESTGLIILTNDGDLALKLTHPRYHLPKTYEVQTQENLKNHQLKLLAEGLLIDEKKTLPAEVEKIDNKIFQITLHEGRNRQIRKMCNEVNLTITSLKRISIGSVNLGNLKIGEIRELNIGELKRLRKSTS